MDQIEAILQEAVDIMSILDSMPFQEANVIEASLAQSTLFLNAAKIRVQAMRARAKAELDLDTARARKAEKIREDASKSGERCSNDLVKERLDASPLIVTMTAKLHKLEAEEEFCKLLLKALEERKDMIEVVNYTNNAEYRVLGNADAATRMDELRGKLKSKYPGKA